MTTEELIASFLVAHPDITREELDAACYNFLTKLDIALKKKVDVTSLSITVTGPMMKMSQLAPALRALREQTGYTLEQVASLMEWSFSKIFRIEAGRVTISVSDLKQLLACYGYSEQQIEPYAEMARNLRK